MPLWYPIDPSILCLGKGFSELSGSERISFWLEEELGSFGSFDRLNDALDYWDGSLAVFLGVKQQHLVMIHLDGSENKHDELS